MIHRFVAAATVAAIVTGCGASDGSLPPSSPNAIALSPREVVDGALRISVTYVVAPAWYRSGLLPESDARNWIGRASTEFARWYGGRSLEESLLGLRNVVMATTTAAGPIVTAVDIQRVDIDPVAIDGDTARVDQASIFYVTHYAAGTWDVAEISGVTMCAFDLRRAKGEWRVESGGCNVSGG